MTRDDLQLLTDYLSTQWLPYPVKLAYDRVRAELQERAGADPVGGLIPKADTA